MNPPPYIDFPLVTNDKITLRKITHSDLNALMDISFYDAVQATTLEQAIDMNEKINADYENGNSIHWAIVDKHSNNVVGTCGYYRGFDNGRGELGCVLLPQFRGQGFMTAALSLAISFGVKDLGLKQIWAVTDQQNEKAIKLLERLGFVQIGEANGSEIEFEFISSREPNGK